MPATLRKVWGAKPMASNFCTVLAGAVKASRQPLKLSTRSPAEKPSAAEATTSPKAAPWQASPSAQGAA